MQTRSVKCPNCSAPLALELGQVETGCEFCGSRLRFVPGQEELEVVRTREEMKRRERVAVQQIILEQKLRQEEAERWREMAGRVAIRALPVVGEAAGKALFRSAVGRGQGCLGCGCGLVVVFLTGLAAVATALASR
jgi:uncharacterized Zn finger protein (UPF0148 family)